MQSRKEPDITSGVSRGRGVMAPAL